MSAMTCITCRVVFHDGEIQREHYKSDWHRYNLKRKVINLAPVTAENFQEKLEAQEEFEAKLGQVSTFYCKLCKKPFAHKKAFENHSVSKKHLIKVKELTKEGEDLSKVMEEKCEIVEGKKLGGKKFPPPPQKSIVTEAVESSDSGEGEGDEDWEEIEGEPIPPNTCLFCNHQSGDIEGNMEHMSVSHSFFIPDLEYCNDIEGLLVYLGEKVGEGMVCLWCNEKGRSFYSLSSVQAHMMDKGHCKILHEGESLFEYADYYDYSSSYPEGAAEVNPDEAYHPEVLDFNENLQLVLPSGIALGHRSLRVYYKQYVNPDHKRIIPQRKSESYKQKMYAKYKAIGYTTSDKIMAQKKHRDQVYVKQFLDKYRTKLGVKGNSVLQTHFRRQVQF